MTIVRALRILLAIVGIGIVGFVALVVITMACCSR